MIRRDFRQDRLAADLPAQVCRRGAIPPPHKSLTINFLTALLTTTFPVRVACGSLEYYHLLYHKNLAI